MQRKTVYNFTMGDNILKFRNTYIKYDDCSFLNDKLIILIIQDGITTSQKIYRASEANPAMYSDRADFDKSPKPTATLIFRPQ